MDFDAPNINGNSMAVALKEAIPGMKDVPIYGVTGEIDVYMYATASRYGFELVVFVPKLMQYLQSELIDKLGLSDKVGK